MSYRLIHVNLSTTLSSERAHVTLPAMLSLELAWFFARDTLLFRRMVWVTFKRERGKLESLLTVFPPNR